MFTSLLFPTDFSPASKRALSYAQKMAAAFGAKLHILHVTDDPLVNAATTSQQFRNELHHVAEMKFAALQGDDPSLKDVIFAQRDGASFVEIIRYAREQQIDCIVMATHGRSALVHALLGSVAENVLRFAPCPVLAVPDPQHEFELP